MHAGCLQPFVRSPPMHSSCNGWKKNLYDAAVAAEGHGDMRRMIARPGGLAVRLGAMMVIALLSWCWPQTADRAWAGDDLAIGFIKTVSGQAEIIRRSLNWPMTLGAPVYVGDVMATGPDGSFGITLADDTRISGGPNTRLELKSFRYEPIAGDYSSIIDMLKGSILYISGAIARLAPDAAKVETPRGTIAVRGTRFLVRVEE